MSIMKKAKIAALALIAGVALTGCKRGEEVKNFIYTYDARTGLCYSTNGAAPMADHYSHAWVPCTPEVLALIDPALLPPAVRAKVPQPVKEILVPPTEAAPQ